MSMQLIKKLTHDKAGNYYNSEMACFLIMLAVLFLNLSACLKSDFMHEKTFLNST